MLKYAFVAMTCIALSACNKTDSTLETNAKIPSKYIGDVKQKGNPIDLRKEPTNDIVKQDLPPGIIVRNGIVESLPGSKYKVTEYYERKDADHVSILSTDIKEKGLAFFKGQKDLPTLLAARIDNDLIYLTYMYNYYPHGNSWIKGYHVVIVYNTNTGKIIGSIPTTYE